MRRALFALLILLPLVAVAAPEPSPTPTRRPRIADLDKPVNKWDAFLRGLERLLPFGLGVYLASRSGDVNVSASAGNVSVNSGSSHR